eukprot:933810-Rhodomonas_salina.1
MFGTDAVRVMLAPVSYRPPHFLGDVRDNVAALTARYRIRPRAIAKGLDFAAGEVLRAMGEPAAEERELERARFRRSEALAACYVMPGTDIAYARGEGGGLSGTATPLPPLLPPRAR